MSQQTALLYKKSWFYHGAMALAYRAYRQERFRAVAHWVPDGAAVLDVCCGDGSLAKYLPSSIHYRGLDYNPAFVHAARRRGRQVEAFDLWRDPLPASQIVICQVSLFQFYPKVDTVLAHLFEAAGQRLIVSESVRSLTQSRWPWISSVVAWSMRMDGMATGRFRFTPEKLEILFEPYRPHMRHTGPICGGRDWLFVLDK
jgi:SAM-dependent methyltransferase